MIAWSVSFDDKERDKRAIVAIQSTPAFSENRFVARIRRVWEQERCVKQ